jgi:hypothetical protein
MSQCGRDYQEQSIVTMTGPQGNLTRIYKNELKMNNPNACCEGSGGFGVSSAAQPNDGDHFYSSGWYFWDPRIGQYAANDPVNFWKGLMGMKTPNNLRMGVSASTVNGIFQFNIEADDCGADGTPCGSPTYWRVQANQPVPIGQWFKAEVRWVIAKDSTGYFGLAINGQIVAQRSGDTYGAYSSQRVKEYPNNLTMGSVYAYLGPLHWVLYDDLRIYRDPPCGSFPCP